MGLSAPDFLWVPTQANIGTVYTSANSPHGTVAGNGLVVPGGILTGTDTVGAAVLIRPDVAPLFNIDLSADIAANSYYTTGDGTVKRFYIDTAHFPTAFATDGSNYCYFDYMSAPSSKEWGVLALNPVSDGTLYNGAAGIDKGGAGDGAGVNIVANPFSVGVGKCIIFRRAIEMQSNSLSAINQYSVQYTLDFGQTWTVLWTMTTPKSYGGNIFATVKLGLRNNAGTVTNNGRFGGYAIGRMAAWADRNSPCCFGDPNSPALAPSNTFSYVVDADVGAAANGLGTAASPISIADMDKIVRYTGIPNIPSPWKLDGVAVDLSAHPEPCETLRGYVASGRLAWNTGAGGGNVITFLSKGGARQRCPVRLNWSTVPLMLKSDSATTRASIWLATGIPQASWTMETGLVFSTPWTASSFPVVAHGELLWQAITVCARFLSAAAVTYTAATKTLTFPANSFLSTNGNGSDTSVPKYVYLNAVGSGVAGLYTVNTATSTVSTLVLTTSYSPGNETNVTTDAGLAAKLACVAAAGTPSFAYDATGQRLYVNSDVNLTAAGDSYVDVLGGPETGTASFLTLIKSSFLQRLELGGGISKSGHIGQIQANYTTQIFCPKGIIYAEDCRFTHGANHTLGCAGATATGQIRLIYTRCTVGGCAPANFAGFGSSSAMVDYLAEFGVGTNQQTLYHSTTFSGGQLIENSTSQVQGRLYDTHGGGSHEDITFYCTAVGTTAISITKSGANITANYYACTDSVSRSWGGIRITGTPSAGNTVTIVVAGVTKVFEFGGTGGNINVTIGGSAHVAKVNLIAAINASGIAGVAYGDSTSGIGLLSLSDSTLIADMGGADTPTSINNCTLLNNFTISSGHTVTSSRGVVRINSSGANLACRVSDSYLQWVGVVNNSSYILQSGSVFNGVFTRCTIDGRGVTSGTALTTVTGGTHSLTLTDCLVILPSGVALFDAGGVAATFTLTATGQSSTKKAVCATLGGTGQKIALNYNQGGVADRDASQLSTFTNVTQVGSLAGLVRATGNPMPVGGSILIGAATPVVGGRDATARVFASRDDVGAFEYAPNSLAVQVAEEIFV